MLFINTRPSQRAEALSSALLDLNVDVIDLPLLDLKARPLTLEMKLLYGRLSEVSVLVVVSPTAVSVGMQYLHDCNVDLKHLSHVKWIAVGEKTAEELNKYHIKSFVPEVETSEGMLQLPVLNTLDKGAKIAFWRGEGGRQFMMESLCQKGMEVLNFVLYERQLPLESKAKAQQTILQLTSTEHYVVLITSEASWLNWLELIQFNSNLLNKGQYWVLGDRLFNILNNYKKQQDLYYQVVKLMNLKTESIVLNVAKLQGKL
jgi:uroporphyrinogen-III synthase